METFQVEVSNVDEAVATYRRNTEIDEVVQQPIRLGIWGQVLLMGPINIQGSQDRTPLHRDPEGVLFEPGLDALQPGKLLANQFLDTELRDLVERTSNRRVMDQVGPLGLTIALLDAGRVLNQPKQRPRKNPSMAIFQVIRNPPECCSLRWIATHVFTEQVLDDGCKVLFFDS